MKVIVFSKDLVIGYADIEIGDYHMGGLFGTFTPNDFYLQTIQTKAQAICDDDNIDLTKMQDFNFEIKMPDGYILDPLGGIIIYDSKLLNEPIQIELAGVACDVIDRYFKR